MYFKMLLFHIPASFKYQFYSLICYTLSRSRPNSSVPILSINVIPIRGGGREQEPHAAKQNSRIYLLPVCSFSVNSSINYCFSVLQV